MPTGTMSRRSPALRAEILAVAVGIVLAACGPMASEASTPATPVASPSPAPTPIHPVPTVAPSSSVGPESLTTLLDRLVVAPEHLDGYDRDLFPQWSDVDGDGCNTRFEVLIAQAVTPPVVSGSCDLTGGTWLSPYDGVTLHGAANVQIDHLVALAEAWYSGADTWTTERRERFANDLEVPWELNAVSPAINETKSADDPAEWLPPLPSALCPYLESWIGTKVRWGLTIDPAEKQALMGLVPQCPGSRLTVTVAAVGRLDNSIMSIHYRTNATTYAEHDPDPTICRAPKDPQVGLGCDLAVAGTSRR